MLPPIRKCRSRKLLVVPIEVSVQARTFVYTEALLLRQAIHPIQAITSYVV
jgi:hypothetical protein